jgi:hypothetical protein
MDDVHTTDTNLDKYGAVWTRAAQPIPKAALEGFGEAAFGFGHREVVLISPFPPSVTAGGVNSHVG